MNYTTEQKNRNYNNSAQNSDRSIVVYSFKFELRFWAVLPTKHESLPQI